MGDSPLTVQDAADYLSMTLTRGNNSVRLQQALDTATAMVERRVGPLSPTTFTDRVRGAGASLTLPRTPVISLTSITPVGGTALDITAFDLDKDAGIVALPMPFFAARMWTFPAAEYDVAYVAGRATPPADLLRGVLELTRHIFENYKGAPVSATTPSSPEPPMALKNGERVVWPSRVLELIEPEQNISFA